MPATALRTLAERILDGETRTFRRLANCSPTQMRLLLQVAQAGTIAMRDLVRQSGQEKSAVTRAAGVLEARGWLSKAPDTADQRVLRLAVTESGRHIAQQLNARLDTDARALIGGLAPADRAAAERILNRLCALLEGDGRVAKPELE